MSVRLRVRGTARSAGNLPASFSARRPQRRLHAGSLPALRSLTITSPVKPGKAKAS